jgi:hypothetical protein
MAQKYTKIPGVEGPGIPRGKKELPKMTIDGAPGQSKMPSLPAIDDADPLTLLQGLISEVGPLAKRQARAKGMEEMWGFTGKRGITPSDLPGSTVANMINVMDKAMTDPITERINSTTDMIDAVREAKRESKSAAEKSMNFFIGNDMWNDLNQDERQELWESAGMPGDAMKITIPEGSNDISIDDLMKYKLPGFTPEWSYLIHNSPEPPEGWVDMLEQKWKDEGTMPQGASLLESKAISEYYKMRKDLESYGEVDVNSLPQDDRAKVAKLNAKLANLYKTAQSDFDEYDTLINREGEEQPENPVDKVYEEYNRMLKNNAELSSYIKLPY